MRMRHIPHQHSFTTEDTLGKVVALGYFDGVHLGHQKVIQTAKVLAEEKGLKSAVMTFHPHPAVVLGRIKSIEQCLTPLEHKKDVLNALGIDELYIVKFDKKFASLSSQSFVDKYLIKLGVKHIVAGFDFTYGRLGLGTMETMKTESRNQFSQTVVGKMQKVGEKISSTFIRSLIQDGKVEKVPAYLGRHYEMRGEVINGDKRGKQIGFPTANVACDQAYVYPETGVYAVKMMVEGQWQKGVCNIGYKPTFHNNQEKRTIEIHLFDFEKEIYGQSVTVKWYKKMRGEVKFASVDALVEQIKQDKEAAREYLDDF